MNKHIPNFITCLNLLCGCVALYLIFQDKLSTAAYVVVLAAAFDFMDGLIARALNGFSELGKQLDSLADMVSFGVVPGAMMFQLLTLSTTNSNLSNTSDWLPFAGFIITIFSALRLAKFNIDTRQTTSFIGVPTPACTLLVISLPLILGKDDFNLTPFILNPYVLIGITLLFSYLLVSELHLFALKFKSFKWQENKVRFIFMGLAIALLSVLNFTAIPIIIGLYVLLSFVKPSSI